MKVTYLLCALLLAATPIFAQLELPQPSPTARLEQTVGLTKMTVEYARPGKKGRNIFGDLVPYGKMWRTGANASTKVEFSQDVTVAGQPLPAGKYALYTIPGEEQWTVVFHNNLSHWGVGNYDEAEDALRVEVPTSRIEDPVETFTIDFRNLSDEQADLVLMWDQTEVRVPITVETAQMAQANIERTLNPDWRAYAQAANYYLENDMDAAQARTWAEKSVALREHFWNLHILSRAEAASGNYNAAVAAAEKSLPLAKAAENDTYVKRNEANLAEWQPKQSSKKKRR